MEFFLNIFTEFSEFSDKKFVSAVKGLNLPLSHLLCKSPGCYHSASNSKTHVRDRIFKSSPIHHASVIVNFPEFVEFSESSAPSRKNSIVFCQDLRHSSISSYNTVVPELF